MQFQGNQLVELVAMHSLKINIPVAENNVSYQKAIDSWPHLKLLRVSILQVKVGLLIGVNIPKLTTCSTSIAFHFNLGEDTCQWRECWAFGGVQNQIC